MDEGHVDRSFSEIIFPLRSRPSQHLSSNSDEFPLISSHERSQSGKNSRAFVQLRRKPLPSKETNRVSFLEDPESQPCADERRNAHLPPKRFKRKPTWHKWRGPLKHASIFLALCTSILLFLLLPLPLSKVRGYEELTDYRFPTSSCEATGFLSGGKWTFVGINIRVGQISFGQAKAADLAFNWAAGRGFQVVLVWLSYRVFTDALMRTTEMAYVPYDLFTSLALYSTKIDALWQLAKGLFTIRGWRVKAIVGWLLFSTAYLAAFPSLIDAMSGYEASMTTMLILPNMTVIDMTDVYSAWDSLIFNNCTNNTNPALVCFQFYDKTLQQSFDDSYQNDSYQFYAQDSNHIDCKADQNLYQWGFSAEWLLVVAIVNSFWLFGLWILWLDATTQSQLCRKGRRMGTYRAIADIAAVMREDLGPNLCAYSEAELTAAVRKQRPIKYFVSDEKGDEGAHIGLSSRPSGKVKLSWDQVYGHRRE